MILKFILKKYIEVIRESRLKAIERKRERQRENDKKIDGKVADE